MNSSDSSSSGEIICPDCWIIDTVFWSLMLFGLVIVVPLVCCAQFTYRGAYIWDKIWYCYSDYKERKRIAALRKEDIPLLKVNKVKNVGV